MQANRSRDTQPELAVRRLLHAAGLRYRVAIRPVPTLPRRADIVFTKSRIAVFIDGCFWHGCPQHGSRRFGTNSEYWTAKIARNKARDADTTDQLQRFGWTVLRYWEHADTFEVAGSIADRVHRGLEESGQGADDARARTRVLRPPDAIGP